MIEDCDLITIGTEALTVDITPLGAELMRLRDADGRDLLWDGDPSVWAGRAPLLFPIVGAVREDRYLLDNRRFGMPKHGFARRKRFTPVDLAPQFAVLRLEPDEQTRAAYPFDFRLDVRFEVQDAALTMSATVSNLGNVVMPASFGFHPALRWPLPYGQPREAHGLRFEGEEREPIRRLDAAGLIDPAPRPTPVEGDALMLADALFVEDAIIFDRLRSRSVVYGAAEGPSIVVEFPEMPQLGVWTKPGAGYICIEPWQGYADPAGFSGDFRDKPGVVAVAPGEDRVFAMRLRLVA